MFVKIENYYLNTDQIVSLEPQGKVFRVNLSNGAFLVLSLNDYLVLIKAMKIKSPLKAVKKKKVSLRVPTYKEFEKKNLSPAVSDKAKSKRVAVKGTEDKKVNREHGKGASGGKPKTKLVKKVVIKKE